MRETLPNPDNLKLGNIYIWIMSYYLISYSPIQLWVLIVWQNQNLAEESRVYSQESGGGIGMLK